MSWFKWLLGSNEPKYRMVPDERGTYNLEKLCSSTGLYLTECVRVQDKEHANELISQLERRTIYLVEADTVEN